MSWKEKAKEEAKKLIGQIFIPGEEWTDSDDDKVIAKVLSVAQKEIDRCKQVFQERSDKNIIPYKEEVEPLTQVIEELRQDFKERNEADLSFAAKASDVISGLHKEIKSIKEMMFKVNKK